MINDAGMVIVRVKDILGDLTTINNNNSYRYKDIKKVLADVGEHDILLDLHYIELSDYDSNEDFLEIVKDSRVHFRVYNNQELYKDISFMLTLSGACEDGEAEKRIENIIIEMPSPPDARQIEKERISKLIDETYKLIDGVGEIKLCDTISVINRDKYIEGIKDVVMNHKDETSTFRLHLYGMEIVAQQLETLSNLSLQFNSLGLSFELLTDNIEISKVVNTYLTLGLNRNLSVKDRADMLETYVPIKTAGMLTTYVKGGRKDEFNRKGNGKPATILPAVYLRHDEEFAYFTVFRERTFSRHLEYELRNDGEEHPGIEKKEQKVRLSELGICACCVGSGYHFNMPLPTDNKKSFCMYRDSANEELDTIYVHLPQFIKMVLDDWEIDYNITEMERAIKITNENIRRSEMEELIKKVESQR